MSRRAALFTASIALTLTALCGAAAARAQAASAGARQAELRELGAAAGRTQELYQLRAQGRTAVDEDLLAGLRALGYAQAAEEKPYLGVSIAETEGQGVEIVEVMQGQAAEHSGLQVGDRLTAIGGREFVDFAGLSEAMAAHRPGESVTLRVERGGETLELAVVLGSRPGSVVPPTPEPPAASDWTEEIERQAAQTRDWAEAFRQRMDELRRDFDEHLRGLEGFVPRLRQELQERTQSEPAARELLEHLEHFRAETLAWREVHRAEMEQLQARMQELREQHVERLRALAQEARQAWRARTPEAGADAPAPGRDQDNVRALRQRVEELRRAVDELRRRLDEGGR